MLKTGIPWEYFPQELDCCGMTLWNRLRDWPRAGVWQQLHRVLLQHLADAGKIDWRRASADALRIPAKATKSGGVWHTQHRTAGVVPHSSVNLEAHWTKSGWHGWGSRPAGADLAIGLVTRGDLCGYEGAQQVLCWRALGTRRLEHLGRLLAHGRQLQATQALNQIRSRYGFGALTLGMTIDRG